MQMFRLFKLGSCTLVKCSTHGGHHFTMLGSFQNASTYGWGWGIHRGIKECESVLNLLGVQGLITKLFSMVFSKLKFDLGL
jgi:hypothetical protein